MFRVQGRRAGQRLGRVQAGAQGGWLAWVRKRLDPGVPADLPPFQCSLGTRVWPKQCQDAAKPPRTARWHCEDSPDVSFGAWVRVSCASCACVSSVLATREAVALSDGPLLSILEAVVEGGVGCCSVQIADKD